MIRAKDDYGGMVSRIDIYQRRMFGNPGVARRGVECIARIDKARRLRELPRQRMFAPAAADQKDVHGR